MYEKEQKEAFIKEYWSNKAIAETTINAVLKRRNHLKMNIIKMFRILSEKRYLLCFLNLNQNQQFHCKEQIIYTDKGDIVSYQIRSDQIIINGNTMCIKIVKASWQNKEFML